MIGIKYLKINKLCHLEGLCEQRNPRQDLINKCRNCNNMMEQKTYRISANEKMASRFKQSGRSMIEMLGVLAIIAVLSVGGIAGYSKAMLAYKSNIQRQMLSELLRAMIEIKPKLGTN